MREELQEKRVRRERYKVVVGSVLNKKKIDFVIKQEEPDAVFHVAAYKHVSLMQENVGEAIVTNVFGTKNVVDASIEGGVGRFIFVSTDKVVNPTSVMGASKRIAEYYVQSLRPGSTVVSVVRFGNVINSQGSALPLFEEQIKKHRHITLTDRKMKRFFMSIREAAELVIMSGTRATKQAMYVLDMGDLISLREVASCLVRSMGLRLGVDVEERIIGRRPGEKMEEELFTAAEKKKMRRTSMANIYRLELDGADVVDVEEMVIKLRNLCDNYPNRTKIIKYLREIFPTMRK